MPPARKGRSTLDAVGLRCRPGGAAHAALRRRVERLCALSELCADRSLLVPIHR